MGGCRGGSATPWKKMPDPERARLAAEALARARADAWARGERPGVTPRQQHAPIAASASARQARGCGAHRAEDSAAPALSVPKMHSAGLANIRHRRYLETTVTCIIFSVQRPDGRIQHARRIADLRRRGAKKRPWNSVGLG